MVEIILDNNQLTDDIVVQKNFSLRTLTLNNNNFKQLPKLLHQLADNTPNLRYLSLLGNECCPDQLSAMGGEEEEDYQRYRYYVLFHLPNLKFLDSRRVSEDELNEAQRIGAFMKTVSLDIDHVTENSRNNDELTDDSRLSYNPLPIFVSKEGEHKSSFGKSRYVYQGKQSEGNRFIVDGDL